MCPALLIPMGGHVPSKWTWRENGCGDGEWEGREQEEKKEEKLWLLCKINFLNDEKNILELHLLVREAKR